MGLHFELPQSEAATRALSQILRTGTLVVLRLVCICFEEKSSLTFIPGISNCPQFLNQPATAEVDADGEEEQPRKGWVIFFAGGTGCKRVYCQPSKIKTKSKIQSEPY